MSQWRAHFEVLKSSPPFDVYSKQAYDICRLLLEKCQFAPRPMLSTAANQVTDMARNSIWYGGAQTGMGTCWDS